MYISESLKFQDSSLENDRLDKEDHFRFPFNTDFENIICIVMGSWGYFYNITVTS